MNGRILELVGGRCAPCDERRSGVSRPRGVDRRDDLHLASVKAVGLSQPSISCQQESCSVWPGGLRTPAGFLRANLYDFFVPLLIVIAAVCWRTARRRAGGHGRSSCILPPIDRRAVLLVGRSPRSWPLP